MSKKQKSVTATAPTAGASPASSTPQSPGVGTMSATAGPISAAMGGSSGTGVGAENFTSGLAPVTTPKMGQVTNGDLSNPASIANLVQGYQNQANNANSQRYGQPPAAQSGAQRGRIALTDRKS